MARSDAAPPATIPPSDSALIAVRERLAALTTGGEVPSIAVAVVREGRIVWLEGIGWANRERGIPAGPRTVYAVGSLSKSITATALMRLVERGRLSLEDPVASHGVRLPDPLGLAGGLRIRHSLAMTGGIPHGKWQEPPGRDADYRAARLLARHGGPVSRPGTEFLYSNLSYAVLEAVAEHATGRPFESFLEEQLLAPLGMKRSGARIRPGWGLDVAWKHDEKGQPLAADYDFYPTGGGGLHSCAADLARYALLHLGALAADSILTPAALGRLHSADAPGEPSHRRYFAGWGIIDDGHETSWLSDGQIEGASSALLLVPERSIGVVCLVNRTGSDALFAAIDVVEALLPGYRHPLFAYIERMEAAETPPGPGPIETLAGEWRGRMWCAGASRPVRLEVSGGAEPLWIVPGIGERPVRRTSFSSRPDTLVNGITFGTPGFSGTVSGLDLIRGRPDDDARLRMTLEPRGETLVGAGMLMVEDDGVPVVIELSRTPRRK